MAHKVAFISGPEFLAHHTGLGHPESPMRLAAIWEAIEECGLKDRLEWLDPTPATIEQVERVHEAEYVELARDEIAAGRAVLSTGDTNVCVESWPAALLAAGAGITAVDAVLGGVVQSAFCAVRPPGHHATPTRGMGFCIFNNVAIAARYAQQACGIGRVAIVDWDLHHGNGTQEAFYEDPTVFYFSVHEDWNYPMSLTGLGHAREHGEGPGEGTNLNCPIPSGSGDAEMLAALNESLAPAMAEFRPELVIVSVGFDCGARDPLGNLNVSDAGFAEITRAIMAIADASAGGRIVCMLEGGYDLTGLAQGATAVLETLLGRGPVNQSTS